MEEAYKRILPTVPVDFFGPGDFLARSILAVVSDPIAAKPQRVLCGFATGSLVVVAATQKLVAKDATEVTSTDNLYQ